MLKIKINKSIQKSNFFFLKKNKNFATVNITGDWCPTINVNSNLMIKKKEQYYGDLLEYFIEGDLNITNLETSIDTKERKFNKNHNLKFINKPMVLKSLKSINMHLACLANNHIMDNGKIGLKNTINYLKKFKINYVGAGFSKEEIYKPFLFEKNNQKIAIINTAEGELANEKFNDHVGASDIDSYRVFDQIRTFKAKGYFVIVIAHAGVEFLPVPAPYIKNIYKNFVDEGSDLVVGHHPHVSQGFEVYKNAPIFYSIGNFSMWKKNLRKNCYYSFFLNIEINNKKFLNINLLPFQMNRNSLSLISKSQFNKKIIELNKLLNKSDEIWKEYLNRKMTASESLLDSLTFFYNYEKYKNIQINKHKILSKKYMIIDYFKNKFKSPLKFTHVLDRWEIKQKKSFLSLLKNIFNPFYKFYNFNIKLLKLIKYRVLK